MPSQAHRDPRNQAHRDPKRVMAPQAIYTFKALYEACKINGLDARLHMYDCGERITINDGATVIVDVSVDCGDAVAAPDKVALWLMQHKWLTPFDFKGV